MSGIDNKQDFKSLLIEIENSGEDPMLFIREEVRGKHIFGNHRYIDTMWSIIVWYNTRTSFDQKRIGIWHWVRFIFDCALIKQGMLLCNNELEKFQCKKKKI